MRQKIIRAICCFALILCIHQSLNTLIYGDEKKEPGPKERLQQMYMVALAGKGYRPDYDSDGDVIFKHEGGNYIIQIHEDDDGYFRLIYPNYWTIESEQERSDVLDAASVSNSSVKCAKTFIVRDNVWSVLELFLSKPDDFENHLSRSLSALQSGVNAFKSRMQELREARLKSGTATPATGN
jgi:hypothetical protein